MTTFHMRTAFSHVSSFPSAPHPWIMERTQHADDSEQYTLGEYLPTRSMRSYENDIPISARSEGFHLASVAEKKRIWWRNAIINALFIASWFFFATLLSVYNKWMFSPKHLGFPAPLFVTTIHMFVQWALAAVLRGVWPDKFRPQHNPSRQDYTKKAIPTAIATGLDIGLSNLSLKTITLSFYTMCKSSSLVFVLLFAFLFRLEVFSWRLVGVIFLIFSGVILMVATEAHFVLEGLILVLSASALGGLRWSLTQLLLRSKKMGFDNPASTIYWLSPIMGILLAVISAALEGWPSIFRSKFFEGVLRTFYTLFFLTAPGVIAFCMVMSEFYILQRAGIVPTSIAGIAKEVSTIVISSWFFGDQLTLLNGVGVAITVCGIGLFTHHKYRKSIDSTVPLDAHGNPITDEGDEDEIFTPSANGGYAQPEETILLTSTHDEANDLDEESNASESLLPTSGHDQHDADEPVAPEFQRDSGYSGQTGRSNPGRVNGMVPSDLQKDWNG